LQFLANATRPDIAFTISWLLSYTANPTMQHISALKRVLHYLSGTRSYNITYNNILGYPNYFLGYADASFANTDDLKSITRYVFMMAGGAITWFSKKQSITAMSTTEAKYIALSEAAREDRWLRNLFSELGFAQSLLTIIQGNNKGSIAISKNLQFHKRSKHIELQYHSIREQVQKGEIIVESCRTNNQTADMLTKPLACAKHKQHTAGMGLVLA